MVFKVDLEVPDWDDGGGAGQADSSSCAFGKKTASLKVSSVPSASSDALSKTERKRKKKRGETPRTEVSQPSGFIGEETLLTEKIARKRARKEKRKEKKSVKKTTFEHSETVPQPAVLQKHTGVDIDTSSQKKKRKDRDHDSSAVGTTSLVSKRKVQQQSYRKDSKEQDLESKEKSVLSGRESKIRKQKKRQSVSTDSSRSAVDSRESVDASFEEHASEASNGIHEKNKIIKVEVCPREAQGQEKPPGKKKNISKTHGKVESKVNKRIAATASVSKMQDNNPLNAISGGHTNKRVSQAQKRLQGARFRMLNEKLYTTTGAAAFDLFSSNPELFSVYHEGFQAQVEKWPVNPVSKAIEWIEIHKPHAVIADFGCGEAAISQAVPNKVHSFDLVAHNDHVTACDIAHVPLADNCVDVAVFCLALMGTNYIDYIKEAHRVLRKVGSHLLIYEVVSRIADSDSFVRAIESVGFEFSRQDNSNKMFVELHFVKATNSTSSDIAAVDLNPCIYKRR
eukprot:m.558047 g.558047  ORF g.558047 m.558047 type:complete len:510 (-) comp22196_c0_seq4:293-1822(-)